MRRLALAVLAASLLIPVFGFWTWGLSAAGLLLLVVLRVARVGALVGLGLLATCIVLGVASSGLSGPLAYVPARLATYDALLLTLAAFSPWIALVPVLADRAFPAAKPWALAAGGLLGLAALLLGTMVVLDRTGGDGLLIGLAVPAALCLAVAFVRAFKREPVAA